MDFTLVVNFDYFDFLNFFGVEEEAEEYEYDEDGVAYWFDEEDEVWYWYDEESDDWYECEEEEAEEE